MEHIPQTGPVIVVANHMSHADPFVLAHYIYDAGRWPVFLAKASVFKIPVLGRWLRAVEQTPVSRGTVDAAKALDAAVAALEGRQVCPDLPRGHHDQGARPVADAGQDRRRPALARHRCARDPGRDVGPAAALRPADPANCARCRAPR